MRRPKPIHTEQKSMKELIAALDQTVSELRPVENAANQELRRTLLAAMDALNNAKQIGNES